MLSIGQFSKTCQVSIKTLHHYDKIGLMHPSRTDRWTGYRYYDESLIPRMLLITRLKRYGFSLSDIQTFLATQDPDTCARMLYAQKTSLTESMEETAGVIRELEQHLLNMERTGNIMDYQQNYTVTLETLPDMPLLAVRQKMSVEDFGKYFSRLFEKVAKDHIATNGQVMAVYHDEAFNPECSDIELALGVSNAGDATRVLPGGEAACVIHKGGYSGLPDAYGAAMGWITDNGYEIVNAPYELYLKTRYESLPPEEWETKIVFPVKKK